MESITKNRQPAGTLRAMVARAYGPGQVPAAGEDWVSELGHGWFNVAYLVRLRDGSRAVLKIAPPAGVEVMTYERGAMATELAALRLIREHTAVPVPAVHFADHSRELCDADYFFWRATFTGMAEDVLRDGELRRVDLGWDYDAVRNAIARNAGGLDEVTEPKYVEWDLWDSNVMVRDGAIVSIIDHERAFYGDPLIEGGFTATELPAFGDPAAFMRGYGHGELTGAEQVRRRLYCLYLTLIM
jgi:aminoglycoside phosphotransferase (APT) family kinase protein